MTFIVLAIVTGCWVYRFRKHRKSRPVPSEDAVWAKIIGGSLLILFGIVAFFAWRHAEVETPEINLVDVLLVLPLIAKGVYADMVKEAGETFGITLSVIGAILLAWGIVQKKKYYSSGNTIIYSAETLENKLDALERQLSDGDITEAEYNEKKWKLLSGS